MNYRVRIGERSFAVEIEDLNRRPIVARVDGVAFEVSPENGAVPAALAAPAAAKPAPAAIAPNPDASGGALVSPLPGTVTEVFAKAGDVVEAGTILFVIEAMKMKNSIRSIHAGKIKTVLVSAGQTVAHKQTVVEFEA